MGLSKYTTELRYIVEAPDFTYDRIGLAEYPIFDESYRKTLNDNIIGHYMFDEIGSETPGRFRQRMKAKMNIIMPRYNQLYKSQLVEIRPFLTQEYTSLTQRDVEDDLKRLLNDVRDIIDKETVTTDVAQSSTSDTDVTSGETSTVTSETSGSSTDSRTSESTDVLDGNSVTNRQGTDSDTMSGSDTTETDTTNNGSTTTNRDSKKIVSDTPEGLLNMDNVNNNIYASNVEIDESTDKTTTKDNVVTNNKTTYNHGTERTHDTTDSTDTNNTNNVTTSSESNSGYSDNTEVASNAGRTSTTGVVTESTSDTDSNKESASNIVDDITETIQKLITETSDFQTSGFSGQTMSEMLTKWRETFINIDQMIIAELEPLFMSVL